MTLTLTLSEGEKGEEGRGPAQRRPAVGPCFRRGDEIILRRPPWGYCMTAS